MESSHVCQEHDAASTTAHVTPYNSTPLAQDITATTQATKNVQLGVS